METHRLEERKRHEGAEHKRYVAQRKRHEVERKQHGDSDEQSRTSNAGVQKQFPPRTKPLVPIASKFFSLLKASLPQ